ncbi:FCS-Like Zinc finger 15 [Hirschfeldia incana]|nr:FCS-Like Zinc finger 15 [Hirschfeldia incana]
MKMVGLSIVLESSDNNTLSHGFVSPKPHRVVNKSDVMVTAVASDLRRGNSYPDSGFLEHCFLCRRKLLPEKDIYMYKGDRAFCSVECRSKQMIMDEEESFRRENCSFTAVKATKQPEFSPAPTSSGGGHHRHRRDPRN